MSGEELKPRDLVVHVSERVRDYRPFCVRRLTKDGIVVVERRTQRGLNTYYFHSKKLVKVKPGESLQQTLRRAVPQLKRCEICDWRPARERHFTTLELKAFIRICIHDYPNIQETVRRMARHFGIVDAVLEVAKQNPENPRGWFEAALNLVMERLEGVKDEG